MKLLFSFVILINSCLLISAQTMPTVELTKVIGPSPSVSSIQEYGKYHISAYQGLPDITIPIYAINLKDITVPISISYLAKGIKVDEEASRVGLGWNLNAGGTISREILGLDDITIRGLNPNSFDLYGHPLRNVIANVNLPFGAYTYDISNKITTGNYDPTHPFLAVDLEPDIFTYNILGKSGKFILKKQDTSAVFEDASTNIKIKLIIKHNAPPVNGLMDSCRIIATDANGTIYNFDQFETCETAGPESVPVYITAWYLTKIQSINGETINFHYEQSSTGYTSTLNHLSDYVYVMNGPDTSIKKSLIPHHEYHNVVLTNISFPSGSVNFNYDNRIDIQGDKRLTSIIINNSKDSLVKRINLLQDYFTANSSKNNTFDLGTSLWGGTSLDSNWIKKRLKLTGLTETSSDGQPILSYKFEYNESLLPFKNSTSRDDWGYFNNAENGENLIPDIYWAFPGLIRHSSPPVYNCTPISQNDFGSNNELYEETTHKYYLHHFGANRKIDTNYSAAFMLNKITYPTGGKAKFTYEQNTYDPQNSFVNDSNALLYNFEEVNQQLAFLSGVSYVPNNYSQTFNFNISSADILPGEVNASVNLKFKAQITNITSSPNSNLSYVRLKNSSGTLLYQFGFNSFSSFVNEGGNIYSANFPLQRLPVGSYTVEFFISGNTVDKSSIIYSVTGKWFKKLADNSDGIMYKYAGGLRIKNISNYSSTDSLLSSIDYIYHFSDDRNHNGIPEIYSTGRLLERPDYFDVQFGDPPKAILKSEASVNTNIGYDSVLTQQNEIRHLDVYYNNSYQAIKYPMYYTQPGNEMMPGFLAFPYVIIPGLGFPNDELYLDIFFDYKPEGLKNYVDNGNGKLIKSADYLFNSSSGAYSIVRKIENEYTGTGNGVDVIWADRIMYKELATGFQNDSGAIIGECLKGLPVMYGVYNYFYPALSSTAVLLSHQTETNYSPSGLITTLTDYTYNSYHFLENESQYSSDGEKVITHFKYPLDYTLSGVPNTSIGKGVKLLQTKYIISPVIEKYIQHSRLDGSNLRTVSATLNTYKPTLPLLDTIYTWQSSGPSTSFTPASITSSAVTKDANYKSFISFDSYDNYGNITQQRKINDVNHCYFYGYNSQYPVAEIVGSSYNTAKQYISQSILDNPTSDQQLRDELNKLRINLPNTLIKTYTYAPLLGMTSETDPGGKTTYYEYDSFGRLKLIRDEDGKILKQYDYQYQAANNQ